MQPSFLSAEFLGLSAAAAILLSALVGPARQAAFLAINLTFLAGILLGTSGTAAVIACAICGYALTRIVLARPAAFWPALCGFAALFVYLRRYSFLECVLPESWLWQSLRTVGLSFLFFKVVHVLFEAHGGTLGRFDLVTFANYCLNFTTYISGPIQRFQDYRDQWEGRQPAIEPTLAAHLDAVLRILAGLVKLYVLADRLGPLAEPQSVDRLSDSLGGTLVVVYAYYFCLYLNFSGYCDVVIGVGSLIGVRPPENFNKPFLARNVSEYWSRWHRTLTLWLTAYVFSPLFRWLLGRPGFAVRPLLSANLALMTTMAVSGLWHGTTLNFLLWGLAHGFYLVVLRTYEAAATRLLGRDRFRAWRGRRVARAAGVVLTFNLVAITLVLFRFETAQAVQMLRGVTEVRVFDGSFLHATWQRVATGS